MKMYKDLSPSLRTIMTPGPVEVDPRFSEQCPFRSWANLILNSPI